MIGGETDEIPGFYTPGEYDVAGFTVGIVDKKKKIDGSMSILSNDTVETYVFDENTFTITQEKGEEFRAMTQAKYSYFHKVTETATHYYMYLSKTQCHVVPKDSLKEGTFEELDGILIARLGDRFKKKG